MAQTQCQTDGDQNIAGLPEGEPFRGRLQCRRTVASVAADETFALEQAEVRDETGDAAVRSASARKCADRLASVKVAKNPLVLSSSLAC